MEQRSSNNWKSKPGGWDTLHTEHVDFDTDYPTLSSIVESTDFKLSMCNDYKSIDTNSLVSMFVDDYILERYWNNPEKYIEYYKKARYVMSPDFSLLIGMPEPMLRWNVYRNRLVGYIWQSNGLNVIPTVGWADAESFEYCFSGVKKYSAVAISNTGCINEVSKKCFDEGLSRMIDTIKPRSIIFQCNKKYKSTYKDTEFIFIDSFWDAKRKSLSKTD